MYGILWGFICVYMCTCMCRGQWSTSIVYLYSWPCNFLKEDLPLDLELTDWLNWLANELHSGYLSLFLILTLCWVDRWTLTLMLGT